MLTIEDNKTHHSNHKVQKKLNNIIDMNYNSNSSVNQPYDDHNITHADISQNEKEIEDGEIIENEDIDHNEDEDEQEDEHWKDHQTKQGYNIYSFYIRTNDTEDVYARVLIDTGSDINTIHPEFARKNKIKLQDINEPFDITGLCYEGKKKEKKNNEEKEKEEEEEDDATSLNIKVTQITEKCIFRIRNHLEVIQLYAFSIPSTIEVDIVLGIPWILKHCPTDFYPPHKRIIFSSGYCARHCNHGRRKRKNVNKYKKKAKKSKIDNDNNDNNNNKINHIIK